MSVAPTVGFFPAASSTKGAAGPVVGDKSATDGPLGLFGALLQLVSAAGTRAAPADQPGYTETLNGLASLVGNATTIEEPDAPTPATELDAAAGGPPDLLAELSNILDAIGTAAKADAPLDPVLEQHATALIETIAAALGVPLPVDKVAEIVAPAIGAVAEAGLEAVTAAIAGVTATGTRTGGMALDSSDSAPPIDPGKSAALPSATPADAVDASPLARALAGKLAKLADAIEPKAPELAARLAALGAKIGGGEIDISALAGLGSANTKGSIDDTLDLALKRLLVATPDPGTTAASRPFVAPSLDIPAELGMPAKPGADREHRPTQVGQVHSASAPDETDQGDPRIERPVGMAAERTEPAVARPIGPTHSAPPAGDPASASTAPTTPAAAPMPATPTVTADARAMHAAYSAPVQQINIPQVAFEITRQVQAGATRFQIRLDPPELGRIDVRLDMDAAGNVNARMTVDRAETLDLMQRDHRALERALAQAGLDSSKTNLEFSLRQNPFSHQEQQQHRQGSGNQPWSPIAAGSEADTAALMPPAHILAYRGGASPGGVNLFV